MNAVTIIEFPEWLQQELEKRGMNQADLARLSDLSTAQVSKIINGTSPAGPDAAVGIARALKLSPVAVFRQAGLLPDEPDDGIDPREENLLHLFRQMDEAGKAEVLSYLEWKFISEKRHNQLKDLRLRLDAIPPEKSNEAYKIVNDWLAEIGAKKAK